MEIKADEKRKIENRNTVELKEEILLDAPEAEIKISSEEPILNVASVTKETVIEEESEPKADC